MSSDTIDTFIRRAKSCRRHRQMGEKKNMDWNQCEPFAAWRVHSIEIVIIDRIQKMAKSNEEERNEEKKEEKYIK